MARGRSRGHKGGRKQFSNPDQIKEDMAKEAEKKRWREAHPDSSSEESEDEEPKGAAGGKKKDDDDGVSFQESSGSSSESESDDDNKKKGVEGVIAVENPNRVKQKMKKASQLDTSSDKPQLSRREREELEKQKARAHYQKLHAQGKTEEARADLARLAIIRKQREEAAAKRAAEAKAKEDAAKAKADSTAKALGRKK
eukprot:TRINITY_DN72041_c0_g1_i1.p1 TRINITY_DN72041_c0_g1~~TRINITY_DN72041_c0_g1_i1.p1  ORF type:complete len:198 (+),score=66.71 TRINITY_DN72041_c0_g1_i1:46-639(+)